MSGDISIDEKRVYGDSEGVETVYVASDAGVATVSVSGGHVGEFGLDWRGSARDVAAVEGTVAVATDEDVLVRHEGSYVATGFGPADAVGASGADLLAASPAGEIGRVVDLPGDLERADLQWLEIADIDAPVRAIEGSLVAAADGVYRVSPDSLDHAGLDDARDVTETAIPRVATGDGLYYLGNGWMDELAGAFDVVAARADGLAHCVGRREDAAEATLYEHRDGEWSVLAAPGVPVDVAYGDTVYAVTADGTFLAGGAAGWETQVLGLPGAAALVVP